MVRFLPALAAHVHDAGGCLVLACCRALRPLLSRYYADCLSIEDDASNQPHYVLPMMSVPYAIGLQPEQVQGAPYLRADGEKIAAWCARVRPAAEEGKRLRHIGLVWSGNPSHRRDAKRSIPLDSLAPLLALPGVVFHPLTPGKGGELAAMSGTHERMRDFTAHYVDGFDDLAAHVTALDALVTIDRAPLHLGGALGRPVFALLDHVSHWCRGVAETQPWYDTVELFRQPRPGDWGPVVERVVARLRTFAQTAL